MPATLYEILGLAPTATAAQIKSAHRALVRTLHPDVSTHPDAATRFSRVQEAYDVLSDTPRRREYDAKLASADAAPPDLTPHYTYSNIAAPSDRPRAKGKAANGDAGDPTGFDEIYSAFFAKRETAAASTGPSPKSTKARTAKRRA